MERPPIIKMSKFSKLTYELDVLLIKINFFLKIQYLIS